MCVCVCVRVCVRVYCVYDKCLGTSCPTNFLCFLSIGMLRVQVLDPSRAKLCSALARARVCMYVCAHACMHVCIVYVSVYI
jgi:hypothetical protein